jgi:hypothetical protein
MKKPVFKTLLAAGALVALAGTGNAATQISIYGASAEFVFWQGAAAAFMSAAAPTGLGCATVVGPTYDNVDGKTFIIQGSGCTNTYTDGAVDFRVGNKASYDGIYAVTGSNDPKAVPCNGDYFKRAMADGPASSDTTVKTTRTGCYTITLGAADVPANAFVQTSSGNLNGPNGGGTVSRTFSGIPLSGAGLTAPQATYQPVKVPFGFFVNQNVKAKTCTAGPTIGDYCATDSDCGTGGACSTTSATISNMSREMATQLFGQSIKNWNQMAGFDANPVVLCLRHAGSGTHATMDLAVMNKAWGKTLPTAQVTSALTKPLTWFNDSTGNLMNCMTYTGYNGSVGYADADSSHAATIVGPIRYNGSYPNSQNIISGIYDFYADQTVYLAASANANQKAIADLLLAPNGYLNDSTGSHLSGTAFRNFWAASLEMKVSRIGGNPFLYPSR